LGRPRGKKKLANLAKSPRLEQSTGFRERAGWGARAAKKKLANLAKSPRLEQITTFREPARVPMKGEQNNQGRWQTASML
jgi:hypothetical protein